MTLEELQRDLDELSAWRKSELLLARSLAEQAEDDDTTRYLCRAWTLIIYGHCDNFLKKSTECYVEYIRDHLPENYRIDLMWLIFEGKEHLKRTGRNYLSPFHSESNFSSYFSAITSDPVLNGRSFNYNTLRFFCDWVLQIRYPHEERKFFCDSLTAKRNAIAHGERAYIETVDDCVKWHDDSIGFMDEFKDAILTRAST